MSQFAVTSRGARIVAMRTARAHQMMSAFHKGAALFDPCVMCVYRGMCDADDCAIHLFDLDVKKSPVK